MRDRLEKARRSAEILRVVVSSPTKPAPDRRPYGSGRLFVRADKSGQESWYGSWWADGSRIKRKLGPKRPRGSSQGLTRSQAEAELRKRIAEVSPPSQSTGMKLADAISAYIEHLQQVRQRKPSTIQDYEIIGRRHLLPFFGEAVRIEKVSPDKVSAFIGHQRRAGLAHNSIRNQTNFLHGTLGFAVRRGWVNRNPVDAVELPAAPSSRTKRIEFLTPREVEDLMSATTSDQMGRVDRTLFMTAALTGMRMSELLALRWQDVDWVAGKVRVAEGFVRGRFDRPKSETGFRSVPMADSLGGELERHFQNALYQGQRDFVFAHPEIGSVLDPSKLRKRFKKARDSAELPPIRFHDLRHTFGTQMAAAGAPLRAIQEWMGHADYSTTAIYAHYSPDPTNGAALVDRAFANSQNRALSEGEAPANV